MMDMKFLREAEDRGWQIQSVSSDHVIASCGAPGCCMRAKLAQGTAIPQVVTTDPNYRTVRVTSFDQVRDILKLRREQLALSLKETEECAGLAVDHIAKAESTVRSRTPNFDLVRDWAETLGYELVLRPAKLPGKTMREIAETREHEAARVRRYKLEREKKQAG